VGTTFLDDRWHDVYANVIGLALEPWLIAGLLVQLIHFAEHPACRWLESRPAVWLGTLS
jgi:peptidoglycan/LPS O-acetylase OafA/YrhL